MMKFFRKYNKALLAIFMVLLMVVFLGGSALNTLLAPKGDRVVATSTVGGISYGDHRVAEVETSILAAIGLSWWQPIPGAGKPLEILDWILLTREAEQLGMIADPSTVLSSFGGQSRIDETARRLGRRPDHVLHAMARYVSVRDAALSLGGAALPSEAAILQAAHDAFEKVRIAAVLIPGEAFMDQAAEFTEDQIEAQFSSYREREPGTGIDFGYYVPPSVMVQYARIDRNALAEQIGVADLERKARIHFEENRERDAAFRRPKEEPAADDPESEDEPFEGPTYERSPYLDWDEAEEIAKGIVRARQADEIASRIANWLIERAGDPWSLMEYGRDGYKESPEGVGDLGHYDDLLDRLPRTLNYPDTVSVGTTDFFYADEADDVPAIGNAAFSAQHGSRGERLGTLAFRTKAIVPVVPDDERTRRSDYLASFQTCRYPLTDPDGAVYVFRVIDARVGHVPESVDEVRDRVLADLRLLEGYETAKARGESLRGCEADMSLREAYESDDELVLLNETEQGAGSGYLEPPPFTRASRYEVTRGPLGQRLGGETKYIGGGLGFVPREIVEQCFALADADTRIAVFELKKRATILVVEHLESEAVNGEELAGLRESFVADLIRSQRQAAIVDWFNPERIRARNQFALVTN